MPRFRALLVLLAAVVAVANAAAAKPKACDRKTTIALIAKLPWNKRVQ